MPHRLPRSPRPSVSARLTDPAISRRAALVGGLALGTTLLGAGRAVADDAGGDGSPDADPTPDAITAGDGIETFTDPRSTDDTDSDEAVERPMEPVSVNGTTYSAYTDTYVKEGQWDLYTCEFDVAYSIMKTFGTDTDLDELTGFVGFDNPFMPYAEQTPSGLIIYGGDISKAFCGDLSHNTYAKTRGSAMRRAFEGLGFDVEPALTRKNVERGLGLGRLLWLKTTVDFTAWEPVRWQTPSGTVYPTVNTNDHCVAAIGFNDEVVVIRDCLGPTNTNWERPYEYEVPWDLFMDCWSSSGHDGLLVSPRA